MSTIDRAKIYAELEKLSITLDFDNIPTPGFIQERTFECNTANWKVDKYSLEVTQALGTVRRLYKIEKFNFDSKKRQALTNNEKIKKIPTGKERESAVEELLEDDLRKILDLENEIDALKDLMGAIKTVQDNIKETSSGVRVLMRTMESQINRLSIGTKDDADVAHLHKSLADLDKLEEEMTAEDVEAATESTSDGSGDEVSVGDHKTVPEEASQEAPVGTVDKAASEDASIDSFLIDDSEDSSSPHEWGLNEEESSETTVSEDAPADTVAEAPTNKGPETVKGSIEGIDLSDIGIDIDTSVAESPPKKGPVEQSPPEVGKGVAAEKKKVASTEENKGSPPVQTDKKSKSTSKEISEVDLDDILDSFD